MATATGATRTSSSGSTAAKRSFLSEITTTPKERAPAIVVAGPPGVGKSSLAGHIPGAVALPFSQENTWALLKATGAVPSDLPVLPPVDSWQELLDVVDELATVDHKHRCLVVDTINAAEKLCHTFVCHRDFKGDWGERGFVGYQRGPDVALADWRMLLAGLDRLRDKRDMRIVLLGHVKVATHKNPMGSDYDRYVCDVNAKTWGVTHGWADAVLFFNYFVAVDESGNRAKGKGGEQRIIYTTYSAAYDAKNRFNLPGEVDAGDSGAEAWTNLAAAIKAGRKAA